MQWTPGDTIGKALWIGGGQWAGKTTVSWLLGERFGLTHYHYDAHAARAHEDRRIAALARKGTVEETDREEYWLRIGPVEMARRTLAGFPDYFAWVLDDLFALGGPRPIVAEGWGLRPELVARVTDPRRIVVLAPTESWQRHQAATVPRAAALGTPTSDPALAQRNRLERDRLITADAVTRAHELGVRVITVDGTRGPDEITGEVAEHFSAFLG